MSLPRLEVDPELIDKIVLRFKSQGFFDQVRKDCLADVDSRPAYENLREKVNGTVASFLSEQPWKDDLNKNQLRESLRQHVQQSFLEIGVNKIVEQVVNPRIFTVLMPKVEDVVYEVLGVEKPSDSEDRGHNRLRFLLSHMAPPRKPPSPVPLLPTDLDPVSPVSMNETADSSALNDSSSKINDETSKGNRESAELASNENSHLSGISELSSHGGSTKLDISESAHLPGGEGQERPAAPTTPPLPPADDPHIAHSLDFDNFTNLKEKLKKTDPLHKPEPREDLEPKPESNIADSPKKEDTATPIYEDKTKTIKSPFNLFSEDSNSSVSKRPVPVSESSRNSLIVDTENGTMLQISPLSNQKTKEEDESQPIPAVKEESVHSNSSVKNLKSEEKPECNNSVDMCDISSRDSVRTENGEKKGSESESGTEKKHGSSKHSSKSDRHDSKHGHHHYSSSSDRKHSSSKDSKSNHHDRNKDKVRSKSSYKDSRSREREKGKDVKDSTSSKKDGDSGKKDSDQKKRESEFGKKPETKKDSETNSKLEHHKKDASSNDKNSDSSKNEIKKDKESVRKDECSKKDSESSKKDNDPEKKESDSGRKGNDTKYKESHSKTLTDSKSKDKSRSDSKHHRHDHKHRDDKNGDDKKGKHSKDKSDSTTERKEDKKNQKDDRKEDKRSKDDKYKEKDSKENSKRSKDKSSSEQKDKDRDSRKRKREKCDDTTKKEDRRSRDRDDGDGGHSNKDRKSEKKVKSSGDQESKGNSENKMEKEGKGCVEGETEPRQSDEPSDIDLILQRIGTAIQENEDNSEEEEAEHTEFSTSPKRKKPKIANNIYEVRKIMQARKHPSVSDKTNENINEEEFTEQHSSLPGLNDDSTPENQVDDTQVPTTNCNNLLPDQSKDGRRKRKLSPTSTNSPTEDTRPVLEKKLSRTSCVSPQPDNTIFSSRVILEKCNFSPGTKIVDKEAILEPDLLGFNEMEMSVAFENLSNFSVYTMKTFSTGFVKDLPPALFKTDDNLNSLFRKQTDLNCLTSCQTSKESHNATDPNHQVTPLVFARGTISSSNPSQLKFKAPKTPNCNELRNSKDVITAYENEPATMLRQKGENDENMSVCRGESSGISVCLMESMLDNLMKENILGKMDDGYNSSDSDSTEVSYLESLPISSQNCKSPDKSAKGKSQKINQRSIQQAQRYDSSELYKPRPLIASSSRRNRQLHAEAVVKIGVNSIEYSDSKKPR